MQVSMSKFAARLQRMQSKVPTVRLKSLACRDKQDSLTLDCKNISAKIHIRIY